MKKNSYIPCSVFKIYEFFAISFLFILLSTIITKAETTKDHAVLIRVSYEKNPQPKIILNWDDSRDTVQYIVYKKMKNDINWGRVPDYYSGTQYTDTSVEIGTGYEYYINKSTAKTTYNGFGYIYAGIELPLVEYHGKVLLMVDETMSEPLEPELSRFEQDLTGDGWTVQRYNVPRAETFNPWSVWKVKNLISSEFWKNPDDVKAVILFGRVPVPYSGAYNPDGHGDHFGAWPADVFYAILNATWTDINVTTTVAVRQENHNIPFDGKFDQTVIPEDAILQTGRIDFYKLPSFKESETVLLRNYLDKNHNFRQRQTQFKPKGMIDDGFGLYAGEAFASNAWMNFASLIGSSNIDTGKYVPTMTNNTYLLSYACNAGGYNSLEYTIYADQFASNKFDGAFAAFLGSYVGDWDSEDNLMRAAIASSPSIIECFWAGRPYWFFHHMGLGETMGYSTLVSQNNQFTYIGTGMKGLRGTHVALMGDPTIRLFIVPPPVNFNITEATKVNNKRAVSLSWKKPDDSSVISYNIYRSTSYDVKFEKLNQSPLFTTFYWDTNNFDTKYIYQVRAVKLENVTSGSFYNQSQGAFVQINANSLGVGIEEASFKIDIAPNPASEIASIYFESSQPANLNISIFNLNGINVREINFGYTSAGVNKFTWDLTDNSGKTIPDGIYMIKLTAGNITKFQKIIVIHN